MEFADVDSGMADLALTHGGPSKLLAIGRRFVSARAKGGGSGGQKRLERGKESTQLMRPRARARQLIRTRTHLRAAPGIFVLDEHAVSVYARMQVRTVGHVNDIRYAGQLMHLSPILFSFRAKKRR